MSEKVELGPRRFRENVEWLIEKWGCSKGTLGRRALNTRLSEEAGRRRVCRMQSGEVGLRVRDVEALATILCISPAVLLYGTEEQLKKSWREENEQKKK